LFLLESLFGQYPDSMPICNVPIQQLTYLKDQEAEHNGCSARPCWRLAAVNDGAWRSPSASGAAILAELTAHWCCHGEQRGMEKK